MTPEGFLVCYDVAIARTGSQKYGPGETPIKPGPEGIVVIHRESREVFADATIASFHGKPLVNDHPREDVTPDNWKHLAIGTVINPRRGDEGLLIADVIVTDKYGITLVTSGKVEVSCGYDADYEETAPGEGRQLNIIGNHLALVDRGRCGPRCAIGDSTTPELEMAEPKMSFVDTLNTYLRAAFKAKDSAEVEKIEKEAADSLPELMEPSQAIHVHLGSDPKPAAAGPSNLDADPGNADPVADVRAEIADIRKIVGDMATTVDTLRKAHDAAMAKPDPDDDDEDDKTDDEFPEELRKAKDSAKFADAFTAAVAGVEIVAPGTRLKTFDAAAKPKSTVTAIREMRLDAIEIASKQAVTADFVTAANGGKSFDRTSISVRDARILFHSVAAFKRQINNASGSYKQVGARDTTAPASVAVPKTLEDLNRMNRERKWA